MVSAGRPVRRKAAVSILRPTPTPCAGERRPFWGEGLFSPEECEGQALFGRKQARKAPLALCQVGIGGAFVYSPAR